MKLRLILSLLILSISLGTTYAQDAATEDTKPKKEKKVKEKKEKKEKKAKEEKVKEEPGAENAEGEEKEKKERKPRPPFYDNKLPYIHINGGATTLFGNDIGAKSRRVNTNNFRWGFGGGLEHRTFSALGSS